MDFTDKNNNNYAFILPRPVRKINIRLKFIGYFYWLCLKTVNKLNDVTDKIYLEHILLLAEN